MMPRELKLMVNLLHNQDTLAASCYALEYCNNYMRGAYAPHYPVPATIDDCFYFDWYGNDDGYWNEHEPTWLKLWRAL